MKSVLQFRLVAIKSGNQHKLVLDFCVAFRLCEYAQATRTLMRQSIRWSKTLDQARRSRTRKSLTHRIPSFWDNADRADGNTRTKMMETTSLDVAQLEAPPSEAFNSSQAEIRDPLSLAFPSITVHELPKCPPQPHSSRSIWLVSCIHTDWISGMYDQSV